MCPEIRELALDDLIFSPLHVRKDPGDIGDLLILEQRVKPAQPERCRPG
jgi:hypothetical protein